MAALCLRAMFVLLASCSAVLSLSVVNMAVAPDNVRYSFEPYMETFSEFKTLHAKTYKTERDEAYRYSVFVENVKRMEDHNRKYQNGETTFYMNVNQFSDMTLEEYTAYNRLGRFSKSFSLDPVITCPLYVPRHSSPQSIDWRHKGAVTPVKNQLECGSCWAFSSTGAIEGQNFINTGTLRSFSEQQILDCCHDLYCLDCDGGFPDAAFKFINRTGGLELEDDYPYNGNMPGICNYTVSKAKVEVTACYDVPYGEEAALQDAVGNVGPVSVIIDAEHDSFRSYAGGIYDEPTCATNVPAHAILAVGYGTSNGTDYWIVKNSWGVEWGMKGYVLMRRNHNNMCGIASLASFPVTALP